MPQRMGCTALCIDRKRQHHTAHAGMQGVGSVAVAGTVDARTAVGMPVDADTVAAVDTTVGTAAADSNPAVGSTA